MSTQTKLGLLLANVLIIVFIETFLHAIQTLAVNAAIAVQTWGASHSPDILWGLSEALGPEPRLLTFLAIAIFARDGVEARRLFTLRSCGHYLRWFLGVALQEPRPSWIDERVEMLHCPTSFGLPSGHALLGIVVLVPLAFRLDCGWFPKALFITWYTLMCTGRIYLGTHSTHDLFLATVLGFSLLVLIDTRFVQRMTKWFVGANHSGLVTVGFLLFGIANSLFWASVFRWHAPGEIFEVWENRALANHCSPLNLFSAREGVSAVMAFTGLLGALYSNRLELASYRLRFAAASVFVLNRWFIDVQWLPESMALSGILYALSVYLMFETGPSSPITSPTSKVSFGADMEYGTLAQSGQIH